MPQSNPREGEAVLREMVRAMDLACDRTSAHRRGVVVEARDWHRLMDLRNRAQAATPSPPSTEGDVREAAIRAACYALAPFSGDPPGSPTRDALVILNAAVFGLAPPAPSAGLEELREAARLLSVQHDAFMRAQNGFMGNHADAYNMIANRFELWHRLCAALRSPQASAPGGDSGEGRD